MHNILREVDAPHHGYIAALLGRFTRMAGPWCYLTMIGIVAKMPITRSET